MDVTPAEWHFVDPRTETVSTIIIKRCFLITRLETFTSLPTVSTIHRKVVSLQPFQVINALKRCTIRESIHKRV